MFKYSKKNNIAKGFYSQSWTKSKNNKTENKKKSLPRLGIKPWTLSTPDGCETKANFAGHNFNNFIVLQYFNSHVCYIKTRLKYLIQSRKRMTQVNVVHFW